MYFAYRWKAIIEAHLNAYHYWFEDEGNCLFDYVAVCSVGGRTAIAIVIIRGAGRGLLGTLFHTLVGTIKQIAWAMPKGSSNASNDNTPNNAWVQPLVVKTLICLLVGIISAN